MRIIVGQNNSNGIKNNINTSNTNNVVNLDEIKNRLKNLKNLCERYGVDKKIQDPFFDSANNILKLYQDQNVNQNQNVNVNHVVYQNVNQISNHNSNNMIPSVNQNSNRHINQNLNQNSNRYVVPSINQNSNRHINQVNPIQNQNINSRVNNSNQNNNSNIAQNSIYNSNALFNSKNLSDFDKKKDYLFLEMDQYQYKHIQKYDSRKETECAICLEEFKRNDIIKEFYRCKHIFHKECLKSWLKRSNVCPLCKHDLTEDINKIHL